MNKKARSILRAVANRIENAPESYDQATWCSATDCGTTACVAGHICDIAGVHPLFPDGVFDWAKAARQALNWADVGPLFRADFRPTMGMAAYLRLIANEGQLRLLTSEEEPNHSVRWVIAHSVAADRLERIPKPDEEPEVSVRREIAERIPAKRLTRLLTSQEEPDWGVRSLVADRIPVKRLTRLTTPQEEPEWRLRWVVAHRIPVERLERPPTPAEEPDGDVRWAVSERLRQR
jgi:hypothetical protein